MKRQPSKPVWWILYLILPIYILVAWIFTRLALTGVMLQTAQIGALLLIFFFANFWIRTNEAALSISYTEDQVRDLSRDKISETVVSPLKNWDILRQVGRSLSAALTVMAASLIMAAIGRNLLGEGVIALLYLAPIGWATVRWGRIAGASAALSAALCFDFFFIVPYYTFRIGSLEGWLLLVLFMGMSIVVVGRVMTLFSDAKKRESESNFLHETVILMAEQRTRHQIAEFIATQFLSHYKAGFVKVILYQRAGQPSLLIVKNGNDPRPATESPERSLPVYSGRETIGKITIMQTTVPLPGDDDPMLEAICRLVALAVDRAQTSPAEENLARQQQSPAV